MKIIVDKHEYAKIIRNCQLSTNSYSCSKCALSGVCDGTDSLENMVEIKDEESGVPIMPPFLQRVDVRSVRPCGDGWAYCDGNCTGCRKTAFYTNYITALHNVYGGEKEASK